MISHFEKEFVESKSITMTELSQYAAIGNILPGPMSFYVSGLIGYKLLHFKGLLAGISTCVFPIMLLSIIVFNLLNYVSFNFDLIIIAVLPIIINNIYGYIKKMIKQQLSSKIKYSLFIISLLLLIIIKITSLQLIILFLLFVIIFNAITKDKNVIS